MLLLKYNDLLLELYEVVKEVKTKEDPNYKFSELFIGLNNLLNLEKICDDYFSRVNDLTDVELNNFNGFASLDAASRKKLEEDYIEAYQKGLIDKKFLNEYPNVTDYVAAIFSNELKDSFFSPLFAKVFNKRIKNTYIEDSTLLNIFKTSSINYKKIGQGEDNLGTLFKNVIKEFELLTIIYKANGLNGVVSVEHYDTLLNLADYNEKIVKYDDRLLQMDRYEMYEYIKNHSKDDYISYEDTNIGTDNLVYTRVETTDNYDCIYQSDLLGWVGTIGYSEEGAWFSNVYEAQKDEMIKAAAFYTTGPSSYFDIFIVRDFTDSQSFDTMEYVKSGYIIENGKLYKTCKTKLYKCLL